MGKYEAFEKEYRAYLKRNNLGSRPIQDHEWASIGWEMALAWADSEREKETCECEEWKEALLQITRAFTMSVLHHGPKFSASIFRLCPYCGRRIG